MFNKFLRDIKGAVAPLFALTSIPLIVSAGGVIDYTNAYDQQTVVQDAMDSAALAAGKKIGLLTMAELEAEAKLYFETNVLDRIGTPPPLATSVQTSTITLTTTLHVPTYFLGLIGLDEFVFNLKSQATLALGTLEVVMALDNSGSMNTDNNIATLRDAATALTTTLFNLGATSTQPDPIKVGLAPFAASVNVGAGNQNAAWLDTAAIGTYHLDSMDGNLTTSNGLSYLSYMNQPAGAPAGYASWGGCVEARPMPYDTTDDGSSLATPATMFVPMFSPDEPDNWTCTSSSTCTKTGSGSSLRYNGALSGARNYNNYLPDFGGTCVGNNSNWTCANGSCSQGKSEQVAFERTCKYGLAVAKVTPANITVGGIPGGPNFMCTTTAVKSLTTDQTAVKNAIAGMIALGATNIQEGLMWGWRALSPTAPFSEGRAYTVTDNQKILILMTDGFNTYYPKTNSTLLKSWYGAWGFIAKNHLGTTSTSQSTIISKMNERTALACQNAKAAGIVIYTVAFQLTDQATLDMLTACATDPSMAYQSTSQSALLSAFSAIGDDITLLRISQ